MIVTCCGEPLPEPEPEPPKVELSGVFVLAEADDFGVLAVDGELVGLEFEVEEVGVDLSD